MLMVVVLPSVILWMHYDELERRQLNTGIVAASGGAAGSGTAILIECL